MTVAVEFSSGTAPVITIHYYTTEGAAARDEPEPEQVTLLDNFNSQSIFSLVLCIDLIRNTDLDLGTKATPRSATPPILTTGPTSVSHARASPSSSPSVALPNVTTDTVDDTFDWPICLSPPFLSSFVWSGFMLPFRTVYVDPAACSTAYEAVLSAIPRLITLDPVDSRPSVSQTRAVAASYSCD